MSAILARSAASAGTLHCRQQRRRVRKSGILYMLGSFRVTKPTSISAERPHLAPREAIRLYFGAFERVTAASDKR